MPESDLTARVAQLEKRLRLWKWASLTNLFLFMGLIVALASILWDLGEVRAHSLVLTGEDDAPRASFKVDREGTVKVQLMDKQGHPRAAMQVAANGTPSVYELDAKGQDTAVLK